MYKRQVQGHMAASGFTWMSAALAVYAVVTDTRTTAPKRLDVKQKLWIFLMLGGAVLLVWTSMYIAYTCLLYTSCFQADFPASRPDSESFLTIAALPVSKVGYDEETHLMRSMEIASMPWGMNVSPAVWSKMIPSLDDWPENQPGSREEQNCLLYTSCW